MSSGNQMKVEIKTPQKTPKSRLLLRLLALVVVGKISYDSVTAILAYNKGSEPLEKFLTEAWNDALYPVFNIAANHRGVIEELGTPITLGTPPNGTTSPITELSRECFVGVNFPKPVKDIDNWYLKPVIGQQSNNKVSETTSQPVLVPQPNSWFAFPYCEVTSEVILPIRGSSTNSKQGMIYATIYANESRWRVLEAKIIFENGKSILLVEPDIKKEPISKVSK
eukprot:gene15030-17778_t